MHFASGSQAAGQQETAAGPEAHRNYQLLTDLIAGNPTDPADLATLINPAGFQEYVHYMSQTWQKFDHKNLRPIREWAARELGNGPDSTQTALYPFSGPDLANLLAFFPRATTYVMLALEPVGVLPVFRPGQNEAFYGKLENSLLELLQFNFFFTERMATDLGRGELEGVLPLLLFFLGREQVQVSEVSHWRLAEDGQIVTTPAVAGEKPAGPGVPGVKIVFQRGPDQPPQTLYYFSFNLQNTSWRRHPRFVAFLQSLAPFQTLVKAASYLMHKPHYSEIRQFILTASDTVLQTDEGIPVRYFSPEQWQRRFFGVYKHPIALFRNCYQPDLAELYRQERPTPLPFGIGYHHRQRSSNLMLARRLAVKVEEGGK